MVAPTPAGPMPLPPLNLSLGNSGPAVSGASPTLYANWSPAPWNPLSNSSVLGIPLHLVLLGGAALYFVGKKL